VGVDRTSWKISEERAVINFMDTLETVDSTEDAMKIVDSKYLTVVVDAVRQLVSEDVKHMIINPLCHHQLSIYFTLPEPSFKGLSYLFEK
jgi:hypothetical protein